MSLRVRLVVAFFLLSVVPVGALTYYGYTNNAEALRAAARHEAELLAGELTQRMQVVTGQLTERVGHLVDLANAQEAADEAAARSTEATSASIASANAANDSVASTLSQVAMLLNNVQLRDRFAVRGRGFGNRGRGVPQDGTPAPNPTSRGQGPRGTGPGGSAGAGGASGPAGIAGAAGVAGVAGATGAAGVTGAALDPSQAPDSAPGRFGGRGFRGDGGPGRNGGPPPDPVAEATDPNRITIDMEPIRRSILAQYASGDAWNKLTEVERARIWGEVQQRMLGVQMGIQMGTEEIQKRVAEAQRAASEKAKEAAATTRATPAVASATSEPVTTKKTSSLTDGRLDVTMEKNGEVVHQVNAEVNLPNLLSTVFSTTRRDRGEVPFAVGKDGRIYTPSKADTDIVSDLGASTTAATPPGTAMVGDWVVITTADPTGLALKFGIARPVGDSLKDLQRAAVRNAAIGIGFIGLALIAIVPLSGRLTSQLSTLTEAVDRLAQGDYRARVDIHTKDEFGKVARAFNQMAGDVEQHQREAVGQERIRRELELGRQIQHDMLPHIPLRLGLTEVKGVSVPAREVGGDFFNYFKVGDGKVALLVGDVSGKGVGAALLMANIQASLRTRLALGQDLAALAREIDSEIGSTTPDAVYATLFVAMLDLDAHELRYVNAGHNPQYVLRPNGDLEAMPSTGLPVGLMAGHGYAEGRLTVAPGDVLFFYTDGCVETENATGEMFGNERLEARLKSAAAENTEDVLVYVETDVATFRGATEAYDDATMMAVRVG